MVNVQASVEFGTRGNQDGAEDVAEDKDRNDKGGEQGVGGMEFGHYLWYARSEHR